MLRGAFVFLAVIGALILAIAAAVGAGLYRAAQLQSAMSEDARAAVPPATTPATQPQSQPATPEGVQPTGTHAPVPAAPAPVAPADVKPIVLLAKDAVIHGFVLQLAQQQVPTLTGWTDLRDSLEWSVDAPRAGLYEVEMEYSSDPAEGGGAVGVFAGRSRMMAPVAPTTGWADYRTVSVARIYLPAGGSSIYLRPVFLEPMKALMNLHLVRLTFLREMEEPEMWRFGRRRQ